MEQGFTKFSEFRETDKSLKHGLSQYKDPVSHMCLAGAVVASCSLTQEVTGSSPFTAMTNILSLNSANSVKTFRGNSNVCFEFLVMCAQCLKMQHNLGTISRGKTTVMVPSHKRLLDLNAIENKYSGYKT